MDLCDPPVDRNPRVTLTRFPIIEGIHTLGITAVVIAVLDLRLLGATTKREPVSRIVCQAAALDLGRIFGDVRDGGIVPIAESATELLQTGPFGLLRFLALVGLNPFLPLGVSRNVNSWDVASITPPRARAAGRVCLLRCGPALLWPAG